VKARLSFIVLLLILSSFYPLTSSHCSSGEKSSATPTADALKGFDPNGGAGKKILETPIEGTIDLGLAPFVERIVEKAGPDDIVILEINTFGGRLDAAVRIRDALISSRAPTVAFIHPRAISAGALISLACDTIVIAPGGTIGAATPVTQEPGGEMKQASEKVVSYMREEMRSTAEEKKRRGDIAAAMVDSDVEIEGVIEKGKLLTLSSEKALELKIADAKAESMREVIELLNLNNAKVERANTHWAEKTARLLTGPMFSSMLMTIGLLALLIEFYTPGFGVAGSIGIACLTLFFLGQYAANLAGWEELIIFALGFSLLMLEVFVIPGFGLAGISGIVLIAVAMAMAFVEFNLPWDISWELGYVKKAFDQAAIRLAVAAVVLTVGAIAMAKYFPNTRFGKWLVFKMEPAEGSTGMGSETPGGSISRSLDYLEGKRGISSSVLRPAGIADFDGRRVHVITEGEYVENGKEVEVLEVDGSRVVVKEVKTS